MPPKDIDLLYPCFKDKFCREQTLQFFYTILFYDKTKQDLESGSFIVIFIYCNYYILRIKLLDMFEFLSLTVEPSII